jgi:hypothetical protein
LGFPSRPRGTPAVWYFSHCATSGDETEHNTPAATNARAADEAFLDILKIL